MIVLAAESGGYLRIGADGALDLVEDPINAEFWEDRESLIAWALANPALVRRIDSRPCRVAEVDLTLAGVNREQLEDAERTRRLCIAANGRQSIAAAMGPAQRPRKKARKGEGGPCLLLS